MLLPFASAAVKDLASRNSFCGVQEQQTERTLRKESHYNHKEDDVVIKPPALLEESDLGSTSDYAKH
jgi:hypothetical protein